MPTGSAGTDHGRDGIACRSGRWPIARWSAHHPDLWSRRGKATRARRRWPCWATTSTGGGGRWRCWHAATTCRPSALPPPSPGRCLTWRAACVAGGRAQAVHGGAGRRRRARGGPGWMAGGGASVGAAPCCGGALAPATGAESVGGLIIQSRKARRSLRDTRAVPLRPFSPTSNPPEGCRSLAAARHGPTKATVRGSTVQMLG